MTGAQGTFLALGPVPNTTIEEYRASIGAPPGHNVSHTHRFQLSLSPNKVQTSPNVWALAILAGGLLAFCL